MNVVRGIVIALGVFLASFVLHIIGGASGQDWLFAVAVALIFLSATGFPILALWFAGLRDGRSRAGKVVVAVGGAIGYGLTVSALWAANGRAFAWWEYPLAVVLVGAMSVLLALLGYAWLVFRGKDQPPRVPRRRAMALGDSEQARKI